MSAHDTPDRWYAVDANGLATLCKDKDDAIRSAADFSAMYPRQGPYSAVLLGDVAAERERCARMVETQETNGDNVGGWFELLAARIRKGIKT